MKIIGVLLAMAAWSVSAMAQYDMGQPGGSTPYDRVMAPVRSLLARLPNRVEDAGQAKGLLKTVRGYRYSCTDPVNPQLPEVTDRLKCGDCKAKSLWLADKMRDGSVRYVIGKLRANSRVNHAWIVWRTGGTLYVLDGTVKSDFVNADSCGANSWIPLYSYEKGRIYRHAAIARFGENWDNPPPIVNAPELRAKAVRKTQPARLPSIADFR